MRWMLLLLLALVPLPPARAGLPETPQLRQLTVADGLPSNIVYQIAQDQNGYLWLATADGLVRYDGAGFRIWRQGEGLRENVVSSVAVDADNRVWVGTLGAGVALLDREREQFRYFDARSVAGIGGDHIWSLLPTDDGALWFGTHDAGLHRMDRDGRVTRFMPQPDDPRSLPGAGVTDLQIAPDGSLWVATDHGVARWTGHDFERLPDAAHPEMYVTSIRFDRAGNLWIATVMGAGIYRPDGSWSLDPWGLRQQVPVYGLLMEDSSGIHWLDTYDGMRRGEEGETFEVPLYSNLTRGRVKPQWANALQDSEGGLWFASIDSGLWYLPPTWRQFSVLNKVEGVATSLGNTQVFDVAPSTSGDMWLVGSSGALDRLDPETGLVRRILEDVGNGTVAYAVAEAFDGQVWVGYPGGLLRYDPASGAVRRWGADAGSDATAPADIDAIAQAADGSLWIGQGARGVQVRSPEGRVIRNIGFDGQHGLAAGRAYSQLDLGPDGRIWLACDGGVLAWDAGTGRFQPVPGLPQSQVDAFATDGEGLLWLALPGALEGYRQQAGQYRRVQRLGAEAGLPQVMLTGLTVDRRGILWAASNRGLARIDPVQPTVRVYGIHDGLPGQEILSDPVKRLQDGRLVVSASHGLVIFDPLSLRPATTAPPLVVDAITVRRASGPLALPLGQPFQLQHFQLEHGDRDLQVTARLISYSNVQGHRYRFRLSDFDSDWVEVGASGERTFSQLPPGHYRLEVAGKTADNVWSQVQTIAFTVAPPWWRTWWASLAAAAVAIALLGGLALAYRRRLRRRSAWQLAVHKHELAQQASEAKTRFLATLGHEVRTPMTGVLGMSELLLATPLDDTQRGYTQSIQRAGTHLLRLVNDALDLARIEAGKMELQSVAFDLHGLLDDVIALMAPVAEKRGLAFSARLAPTLPPMVRGDPLRLRQILLNLLGNAIKFTEQGQVSLCADPLADQRVRLEISDTGPGINAEQQARLFQRFEQAEGARTAARYGGSGLGLAICQELAAAMGGWIGVESTPGVGTRFVVELPLPATAAPLPRKAQAPPLPARALMVLLVEDDATVAQVIAGLLRARGHRVSHAAHGLAALTEATTQQFDIALLDLDLPGIDGLMLARQLRQGGFAAPLLAITARADAEAEPQARAAGFDGFLRKPVTGDMLAEAIAQLMAHTETP
ncbi:hybrid sensor histidine kinase/response regulator [Pseudoxanthomonas wuyuanensis]|uniref:histidine kinase n=1 Tax=Pseudoxanthomonas wuyuanensis TaxID=1073196 RepID=A0A286DCQ0_9GAMM|nr:hybrid sensor histidine kinase/response regulator [Pseudoxanthomonas wuyuanensis]KAF1719294.1 histidine kinase [Pseudoxanthomonas wuyuanensis]SOD56389.1 ligand-binding sensor domain-containing protein [Pseudoxanthomonas wuyuanensis]